MEMKKILLDTNAYSNLLRGDEIILDVIAETDIIYMSVIVLAELFTGFKGGKKESWNREILDKFLKKATVSVLDVSRETAEIFSEIKNNLKKSGNPMPINDLWIASHVIETGSVLITDDEHFRKIPGLRLWDN